MSLYPEIEPFAKGMLEVEENERVYWEICGNPEGEPALAVHGGPGSGCTPWWRRLFDPEKYMIVLFDQRGCGRSEPGAGDFGTSLEGNNTDSLVEDMEKLRKFLKVDKWTIAGGSWGSTLSLVYAERHPESVSAMVLFGVTTSKSRELDWTFRGGISRFFPAEWNGLLSELPGERRSEDIPSVYSELLNSPDPEVRKKASTAWCRWESATPDWPRSNKMEERFEDPVFRYSYARLVTHYVCNNFWLKENEVMLNANLLSGIRIVLINGRFDFQAPMENAWELNQALPNSDLVIIDNAGHSGGKRIANEIVNATDSFLKKE